MDFRLLGDLQAWHGGKQLDLGGQRQRCVLAVLLLSAGRVVATERIVAEAWGLDAPPTADRLVTAYISRLRRTLTIKAEVELMSRPPGYLIAVKPELIDLHRFRASIRLARAERADGEPAEAAARLREALELWRGTPFADLHSQVLRARGEGLEAVRLDAVEELAELELAAGRAREVVAMVRELHEEHPERERLAGLLIYALHRSGEPVQAAEAARRAIRAVQALGLGAGPHLLQAQQEVLTGHVPPISTPGAGLRRQLPPATAHFTGRGQELDLLDRLARDAAAKAVAGSAVVAVIEGFGGLGKTALALRAAHRAAPLFPDGQLFLDLRAHTPDLEPLSSMDAMHKLLRTLSVPPQFIPDDPADRATCLRDRLSGTRTLLVLDNAANAAQVRPLIPAAEGCLVIVTARSALPGLETRETVLLQIMPPADSVALLCAAAGPQRALKSADAVPAEIAELCGHIPLAVRLAAARLHRRPALTAEMLASELKDEHRRLAALSDGERSLAAVFDLSLRRLPNAERTLLRRLALIPGTDFDAYAAAGLLETDADSSADLLESLLDRHLLIQQSYGRYRFHDLVRLHVRTSDQTRGSEQAAAESREQEAALGRLLDYYRVTAQFADRRLSFAAASDVIPKQTPPGAMPVLDSRPLCEAWMHAEAGNCVASAEIAVSLGRPEDLVALAGALRWHLRTFGPWARALGLHQAAVDAARSLGDRRASAGALLNLGEMLQLSGRPPEARAALDEALAGYEEIGDRLGVATTRVTRAEMLQKSGDYENSAAEGQRALELLADLDAPNTRARALNILGAVRRITGDLPTAEELLKQAISLYHQLGNVQGRGNALTNLGTVRQQRGEFARAAESYRTAVDIFKSLGDLRGEAIALGNLGTLLRETGDYAGAGKAVERCLEVRGSLGDTLGVANDLTNLGAILQVTAENERAVRVLNEALDLHRQLDNREGIAFCLDTLGLVHRQRGDYAQGLRYLEQAEFAFDMIGQKAGSIGSINSRADIHNDIGEYTKADEFYRRAIDLARKVGFPSAEAHALRGLGRSALHQENREAAGTHLRAALEIYTRLGLPEADELRDLIEGL